MLQWDRIGIVNLFVNKPSDEQFARMMGCIKDDNTFSALLRKIKDITGLTPEQVVREVKLQKARTLLENRAHATVSEVAYAVGFETPEYFSKRYANRFGKRPADYLSKISSWSKK